MQLTEKEIRSRLQKLRNYERLYPELKQKYEEEKQKRKALEQKVEQMEKEYGVTIETLKLQIEELQKMVFGKQRKSDVDDGDDPNGDDEGGISSDQGKTEEKKKKKRSSASYRRRVPCVSEVTSKKHYGIESCPDCGEPLTNLKEAIRYLEDIILPLLNDQNLQNPLKTVTEEKIESGFCPKCRKWHSSVPVAKQVCRLGENVRKRIVYCTTVLGMTFEKLRSDLQDTFGISVSDGEIVNILTKEAGILLPEYHDIDARIRGAPCQHLDESGYPVQKEGEGQWGWVKTASNTFDTLFRLGRSRGKGNANILKGDKDIPSVTDDYPAYKNLWRKHGLCWAHPKRKFRDLAESKTLSKKRKKHCEIFYKNFCALLQEIQMSHQSPYDKRKREADAGRFRQWINTLCTPGSDDPEKLATLKKTFLENTEKYILCILEKNIPMTNNKAERSIRPLVIKRKISFGSKTQKGADVMSILLSVCFSLWWKKPENFYSAYETIIQKWNPA